MDDPYLAVKSPVELLRTLVARGAFRSVLRLLRYSGEQKVSGTSELGSRVTFPIEVITVAALQCIPMTVNPNAFLPWLCDVIIPNLSLGMPLLSSVRHWACKAADHYDETLEGEHDGLQSSILLLEAVSKATARLTVVVNKCFAYPMQLSADEGGHDCQDSAITPRNNISLCTTANSSLCVNRSVAYPTVLNVGMISGMKKGIKDGRLMSAQRVKRDHNTSLDFSLFSSTSNSPNSVTDTPFTYEDDGEDEMEYDCVEIKLTEALRLQKARCLGMKRESLTLADYSSKGELYILKELVKEALSHHGPSAAENGTNNNDVGEIRSYAKNLGLDVELDYAIQQHANELCDSSRADIPRVLEQARTLCGWCCTPLVKCKIVLKMLRSALVSVHRPPDLTLLAKEAVDMAPTSVEEEEGKNVRSELEEATRLLAIDSLVRKYCGNGAQEFFDVSDPSHSVRLVQHVCRHIDAPSVLADMLMLCDAFTHISKLDTCVSLLQRVMATDMSEGGLRQNDRLYQISSSFMKKIYSHDVILAERVGERISAFCAGVLDWSRRQILKKKFVKEAKQRAIVASSTACSVMSVMEDQAPAIISKRRANANNISVAPALKEFQTISKLQSGSGIFITIQELRDPSFCATIVSDLLKPSVDLLKRRSLLDEEDDDSLRNELTPAVATARQWCAILCENSSDVWARAVGASASQVAKVSTSHGSLLLLHVSGILDGRSNDHSSFHAIMSVVLSLCARAFSEAQGLSRMSTSFVSQDEADLLQAFVAMRCMAQASLLLHEHLLLHSPSSMLSSCLSLALTAEFVSNIATRSDMGIGERLEKYFDMLKKNSRKHRQYSIIGKKSSLLGNKRLLSPPVLHETWYQGDGLLLPPLEALFLGASYFKMLLDSESTSVSSRLLMEKSDMMHVLESRGAHTAFLRMVQLSTATSLCQNNTCSMFANAPNILKKNNCVLAERSLGGNESGLTSGSIDAVMALSFLLHLPKEIAFKSYQGALPSAIGGRDFNRIITLASIGTHCGVGTFSSGERFPWSKQRRFIEQCLGLSRNGSWWITLSQFGVGFDPSVFTQQTDSKASEEQKTMKSYCEKLVWNAAKKLGPRSALTLAKRFAKDHGLNKLLPPSALIEFLLSAPADEAKNADEPQSNRPAFDIRHDLPQTETEVRHCLAILPSLQRSLVLRKCVMKLEADQRCTKDYDRHSMVLSLYRECLHKLRDVMKKSDARAKAHEEETGRIERRIQTIIIISSIFENYKRDEKPDFNRLHEPLPRDPSMSAQSARKASVTGNTEGFDPLACLDGILGDDNGSLFSALTPLCSLLGLPPGHVHARSLIVRFRKLKESGSALPQFESSVLPVAKKLRTSGERADLAWWCSHQYDAGSVEQLKCLDMAHANATEASEEAETSNNTEEESHALERVRRVDIARSGLSDNILVGEVLKRHESTAKVVKELYKSIIDRVQQQSHLNDNYCPENLVESLLVEGSLTAANASLDDADGFSPHHFRLLALLVHDACKSLSNRYSHVNVGACARLLTRRWLVHGDDSIDGFTADLRRGNPIDVTDDGEANSGDERRSTHAQQDETEDTSEFVMDIGIISSGSDNQSLIIDESNKQSGITSIEEPSALKPLSSSRETSDHNISRVALRIAFLICFAEDYHRLADLSPEKERENVDTNVSSKKYKGKMRTSTKGSSQTTKCFEGDLALQHARELLSIVFARKGSTVFSSYNFLFDQSSVFDESILSTVPEDSSKEEFQSKSKALSFAMRHRAMRVATILCPQEVILRVVLEETQAAGVVSDDYLNKFAFASFVAMEVEAMGLDLPHSDLLQLSIIHFPSYARTIWLKPGGRSSSQGFNGRLHLLLLELCVYHHETVDWDLFVLIFNELIRLELPRSLMTACECAIQSRAVRLAASQDRDDVLRVFVSSITKVVELIATEVESNMEAGIELDASQCSSTLHRLTSIIITENVNANPFGDLSSRFKDKGMVEIGDVFMNASLRISDHISP